MNDKAIEELQKFVKEHMEATRQACRLLENAEVTEKGKALFKKWSSISEENHKKPHLYLVK